MRRLLGVGLLIAMLAMALAGCDFMAFIDDLVDRIMNPVEGVVGIGGVTFVQITVEYGFDIEVMTQDAGLQPWWLFASIESVGQLAFDAGTTTYTTETPQGADPYVKMSIGLDPSGSMIRDLHVERRMTYAAPVERIDELVAFDIPYDRIQGDSTFYRIDVPSPQWIGLELVDYRDWQNPTSTEQNSMRWVVDPRAMDGYFDADPDRFIEIEFRQ